MVPETADEENGKNLEPVYSLSLSRTFPFVGPNLSSSCALVQLCCMG